MVVLLQQTTHTSTTLETQESSSSNNANNTPSSVVKTKSKKTTYKNNAINAVAGACAGALAKTSVAPIERVKLLMQLRGSIDGSSSASSSSVGRSLSSFEVAAEIFRTQGILAFWRGNTPNVIRQGGTASLNFMLMDSYKQAIGPLLSYDATLPSFFPRSTNNHDNNHHNDHTATARRRKRRALLSSFLSGGLAGGTTTTLLYPVEFLRTRLAMDMGSSDASTRKYPRGMRDVFCSIYRVDGARGLYQGYGIALVGVVLYRALHLGGYDVVKEEILQRQQQQHSRSPVGNHGHDTNTISMGHRFLAAQSVSIVAGTFCYPIDSVRRRLMMQAGLPPSCARIYHNSMDCFRKVASQEGLRGFYLGIGPNIMRSFGGAFLLVGYDTFKGMVH